MFSLLTAISLGLIASTLRWLTIDRLMTWLEPSTCVELDFRELRGASEELLTLVEGHYRFYQFYSNSLVASVSSCSLYWLAEGIRWEELAALLALEAVLLLGARDTYNKYHRRVQQLLAKKTPKIVIAC